MLETGQGSHPLIDQRIQLIATSLQEAPTLTLGEAFQSALNITPAAFEEQEEKTLLLKLFTDLGTGTLEKRRDLVGQGIVLMQVIHEKALETYNKNGRLYRTLGWLAGLALMLLLI